MIDPLQNGLRLARLLVSQGFGIDEAVANPAIQASVREEVRNLLRHEETIFIRDPRVIADSRRDHFEWLHEVDRSAWYYWPELRNYLLTVKSWPEPVVRSIDDATDRVLSQLEPPSRQDFLTRGLVLGYVQSGKTANFTALIAKAADAGYRLFIVLSGIHNSLRQQTQRRLTSELVGYADPRQDGVPMPPIGRQWHTFTTEDLAGDFDPGAANPAALQGTEPVLIVCKKNGRVLERLLDWLDRAPRQLLTEIPVLVIDDEADQASINTAGNRRPEDEDDDEPELAEEIEPSRINLRIRELLNRFQRKAYVAYTATPFANVLIDHSAVDVVAGQDLYPRDFIIDLPKPWNYFGPEEIFGYGDPLTGDEKEGLDVVRHVDDEEVDCLRPPRGTPVEAFVPCPTRSLSAAIEDYILAGAARRSRGDGDAPATMLIHTSQRVAVQSRLLNLVQTTFFEIRDEWRYQRTSGIRQRFKDRWDIEFRPHVRALHIERDLAFGDLEEHIGPFLEAVQVKQLNSQTEDILDYERDPSLKAIVVGGNRLSRGLTLEGLAISFYVRESGAYDTLMQMGRWFGYRAGYEDLMRIYTTPRLESWFRDLALVESDLRADIQRYENEGLTPLDFGVKIRRHPAMLVTSPLKMRSAATVTIEQSYAGNLLQTINFPFDDWHWLEKNITATQSFLGSLGNPDDHNGARLLWNRVSANQVIDYLHDYQIDPANKTIATEPLLKYIIRQVERSELTDWTVALVGRESEKVGRFTISNNLEVNCIERTRLRNQSSLGVITNPDDEAIGLDAEQLARVDDIMAREKLKRGQALRTVRSRERGLMLIYPVSRMSGQDGRTPTSRQPIYASDDIGPDVVGIAFSFPYSENAPTIEYVVGTVGI